MDLIDKLNELAGRIHRQKDLVLTEEATKTAFVLPFLQVLGYDVFNPLEVIPEFTADHGVKKGEKVDYAITQDEKIVILIECKPVGAELDAKYAGQLFRYFSVTEARFGVLTDGVRYLFFSDLEKPNKMDERPFLEFNLSLFGENQVEELKKFTKSSFDLETIISTASNMKYLRALTAEIRSEFESPSEELVRLLTTRVNSSRFTQQVKEQFTGLCLRAMKDYLRDQVNDRLKSALETDQKDDVEKSAPEVDSVPKNDNGIVTTPEELESFRIIRAIGAESVDPERIVIRDSKSYCAILFDDNNRKPICRLYYGKVKKSVGIFIPDGEKNFLIEKISNLYQLKDQIKVAIQQYS